MKSSATQFPIDRLLAHREWVRHVARAMVHDQNDADDLEQGMWLEALQRPPRSARSLRGWLATVLRRDLVDRRRSESCRNRREQSQASAEVVPSTDEVVAKADADRRVVVAVMELAEPYRSTVLYRFFEDIPPSTIAERQGVPVSTVRTRLQRALAQLRERFDAESEGDRERWCLALLPLLRRPQHAAAANGTVVTATTGALLMGVKAKVAVALVAVALVAGGVFVWATSRRQTSTGGSEEAVGNRAAQAPARTPTSRAATARRVPSEYGADGRTFLGEAPGPANVFAWRVGEPRSLAAAGTMVVFGQAWFDVPAPSGPAAETRSDGSGAFALDGLGPGAWLVVATFSGGQRASRTVDVTRSAPRPQISLVASTDGFVLHGRAIHRDGSAFTGWIGVRRAGVDKDALPWIPADDTGAFSFSGLAAGDVTVVALETGRALAQINARLPRSDEVILVLDPPAEVRHGRVAAAKDGAPVAGATVVYGESCAGTTLVTWMRTTTAEDGRFDFVTRAGKPTLEVSARGFATATVRPDCSTADEVVVRLERPATITGHVLRAADGKPAEGALVHVLCMTRNLPARETIAASAADGSFRLEPSLAGELAVYALGGGWASERLAAARWGDANSFVVTVDPGTSIDLDLRVVPTARCEGRVLDAAGAPAPRIAVDARRDGYGATLLTQRWFMPATSTRDDGTFALDDLCPDFAWMVSARPTVGMPSSLDPISMSAGQVAKVEIRLDPDRRVDVTVLEAGTEVPIGAALVTVAPPGANAWDGWSDPTARWTTDANGFARAGPVGAGEITVHARAPGHADLASGVVPEKVDEHTLRAVVHLSAAKPLAGRFVLPDGVRPDSAWVNAQRTADGNGPVLHGEVDGEGNFRFDSLPDDTWSLYANSVWFGHHYQATATVRSGDTGIVLTLAETTRKRTLRIRILDAQSAPVPDGSLAYQFRYGTMGLSGTVPIRRGEALVEPPEAPALGVVEVRPIAESRPAPGAARVELPSPLPTSFEIRLPSERRIAGRVVGPDGAGIVGVRVIAQPVLADFGGQWRSEDQAHGTARTSRDGSFDVGGLGDFTYRLTCAVPAELAQPLSVTAAAGSRDVVIRLGPAAAATVSVEGPDGSRLSGCQVSAFSPSSGSSNGRTSAAGSVALSGLDPSASYELRVQPPLTRDDLVESLVQSWTPGDTTVRLAPRRVLEGTARDHAGQPVSHASVLYAPAGSAWRSIVAGPDGRFRIDGLRAGEAVRLRALGEGGLDVSLHWPKEPESIEATPGDADVAVIVDDRPAVFIRVEGVPAGATVPWTLTTRLAAPLLTPMPHAGSISADGMLRFDGLDPALRHGLLVGPTREGLVGFAGDLVPGSAEVVIRLARGETLSGRVVLPPGVSASEVALSAFGDLWTAHAQIDGQGRFQFDGLPPGECLVAASAIRNGKALFSGSGSARTGADVTIELQPVPSSPK
jgi:RNA polymerase sigma factor (sigma-70 family)